MTRKRTLLFLSLAALIAAGGYLLAAFRLEGLGFPLDDSWIYQCYARNLATYGEWAFVHGTPSAGSTGPLWAVLLSIGYVLRLPPLLWAYSLGLFLLVGLGMLVTHIVKMAGETRSTLALLVGLGVILDWHMVWAAVSGMETLLFCLLVICMVACLFWIERTTSWQIWLLSGALVGVAAWVRPEGVTLAGPFLVYALLQRDWRSRAVALVGFLAGLALIFAPYLAFNQRLAGAWWPNTFYAKQREYAILVEQHSLAMRLVQQFAQLWVGVGFVLFLGFVRTAIAAIRQRRWPILLSMTWMVGHLTLYALRLPVTYQHGRYVMPAIVIYLLWGWWGSLHGLAHVWENSQRHRLWVFAGGALTFTTLIGFLFLGAIGFGKDVTVIQTEMVATSRWIASELPPEELIAAHDIGALGYFAPRPIIDLAGLVSPDVIPFIRAEERLAQYLDEERVVYLMTLKDWYDELPAGKQIIYETHAPLTIELGAENMAVYRWMDRP